MDDDEDYAVFVQQLLARMGYESGPIEIAHDEPSALRRVDEQEFDVVVSDLELSPGNGLHILKHVRDRWPQAQRILLTSAPEKARTEMKNGDANLAHGVWDKKWELGTIRAELKRLMRPGR